MPEAMLCKLSIVTQSGAVHTSIVDYHKGHYRNPMSDQEVAAKFRPLAARLLSPQRTDELLDRLWKLDEVADVAQVVRLMVADSGRVT